MCTSVVLLTDRGANNDEIKAILDNSVHEGLMYHMRNKRIIGL